MKFFQFFGGPLHGMVAEFTSRPRKYSVVANNTLHRYWIDDAETITTEAEHEGEADEILRGVEIMPEEL